MLKKHCFEPIYQKNSRILILGTMPSIRSVKEGFYYMHPQNRFWKVLSCVYSYDFYNASIEKRIEELLRKQIALFDIIDECEIEASKDSSIQKVKPQDIKRILEETEINKIILNGKKAYSIFTKTYPEYINIAYPAPSTSAANASFSLEKSIKDWKEILI